LTTSTSPLQAAIDVVEQLSDEDQAHLLEIIYQRLIEKRREQVVQEVKEARSLYRAGQIRRGTIDALLHELDT
jgi:hypothetical protein